MSNIYSNGVAVSSLLTAPQVFQATHDGNGNLLSSTRRSYISFSWGGRNIEDFDFIVTNGGDMYNKRLYADFKDLTTSYDIIDGQHFWKTTYEANEISFTLSTDGVSESILQSFRNYFQPGIERELQVSEFPNRAIMARIAEAPDFEMLPFEKPITVKLGDKSYTTSTTIWKGSLNIHFVMDDPFWYNKRSIFTSTTIEEDYLKAIVEDGIPHINMFDTSDNKNYILGNGYIFNSQGLSAQAAANITLNDQNNYVLYYCGTAKEKPKINFSFNAYQFDNDGYCNAVGNEYVDKEYGKITIGKQMFEYTTPSILSAYNQAIYILKQHSGGNTSIVDLKKDLRNGLNHFYIRMWALAICEQARSLSIANAAGALTSNYFNLFKNYLQQVFYIENNTCKCTCTIDSATGEAVVKLLVNTLDLEHGGFTLSDQPHLCEENSGDMIRSHYLIIDERVLPNFSYNNYTASNGNDYGSFNGATEADSSIEEQDDNFATITAAQCLPISSNYTINDVQIIYHYKYL